MAGGSQSLSVLAQNMGLKLEQFGTGQPLLVLHGGGGKATVAAFAQSLADSFNVILPTHPGFDGTERSTRIFSIKELAAAYVGLLAAAKLENVVVIGFSMGGWIAAEMAVHLPQTMAGLILVDAVGITVSGEDVLDVFSIAPNQIADFSFHEPNKFRIDMAALSPEKKSMLQANFAALAIYGRALNMQDPDLAARLSVIDVPSLVIWGESDRVASPTYGKAFAAAMPGSCFELIASCGHLPQLEQPAALRSLLEQFAKEHFRS
jgi:pimeloyl-ACP methyl ester carboxylesterase